MSMTIGTPSGSAHAPLEQRDPRRRVARDAVDGAAGERRGAAEVEAADRRPVRRRGSAAGRKIDLVERVGAGADVAADEIRVARARGRPGRCTWRARMRSRKPGAKRSTCASTRSTWRSVSRSQSAPRRPVRVGPGGVLPGRGAGRVGDDLLAEEQEGALGEAGAAVGASASRISLASPPTWTRARLARLGRGPWHRGRRAPSRPSASPARAGSGGAGARSRHRARRPRARASACGVTSAMTSRAAKPLAALRVPRRRRARARPARASHRRAGADTAPERREVAGERAREPAAPPSGLGQPTAWPMMLRWAAAIALPAPSRRDVAVDGRAVQPRPRAARRANSCVRRARAPA